MLRKVFWDKDTGEVIVNISWDFNPVETSFDEDYEKYPALLARTKESLRLTIFQEGEYEQDFRATPWVRINPETETPEFHYPNPNEPEAPPVFQQPLTEQVKALEAENAELKKLIEQTDRENKNAIFEIYTMIGG